MIGRQEVMVYTEGDELLLTVPKKPNHVVTLEGPTETTITSPAERSPVDVGGQFCDADEYE